MGIRLDGTTDTISAPGSDLNLGQSGDSVKVASEVQLPTAGALSSRRININGAMQVAQRGTTVTGIGVDDFTCCDRWRHFASAGGQAGRCTATQENVTDLAGFHKALKLQVTTTETPASDESYGLNTRFEVQDIKGLGIGSANSVPLTLSFYAKAPTGNGVFCAGIVMSGGGSYIEEVTIGTSWSRHEINIPATSISSHATTQSNDVLLGLEVQITLMAGSSVDGHANGVWENGGSNRATSNQSNFYSSTSNNLFVTGVQLERGTKATPFEHRSFGDELARCQRYYETTYPAGFSEGHNFNQSYPFSTSHPLAFNFIASDDTLTAQSYTFQVSKRGDPTVRLFNANTGSANQAHTYKGTGGTNTSTSISVINTSPTHVLIGTGLSAINECNESYFHIVGDSEL